MARFPFLQRGSLADYASELTLATYTPALALQGLTAGIDNVRHDVFLSPKFCDGARLHLARLIAKYGNVEDLVAEKGLRATGEGLRAPQSKAWDPAEFKRLLTDLHLAALNRAKIEANVSLDLLARLAVLKFLRAELGAQFAVLLERCRARLKALEGPRQATPREIQLRERAAAFQLAKKNVLRKAGQEIFHTLREMEKESLLRMRRSLFPDGGGPAYDLF